MNIYINALDVYLVLNKKEKAREEDFEPILEVGLFKGNPAVRTLNYDNMLRSTQIAGFMVAILDCMVDMMVSYSPRYYLLLQKLRIICQSLRS